MPKFKSLVSTTAPEFQLPTNPLQRIIDEMEKEITDLEDQVGDDRETYQSMLDESKELQERSRELFQSATTLQENFRVPLQEINRLKFALSALTKPVVGNGVQRGRPSKQGELPEYFSNLPDIFTPSQISEVSGQDLTKINACIQRWKRQGLLKLAPGHNRAVYTVV